MEKATLFNNIQNALYKDVQQTLLQLLARKKGNTAGGQNTFSPSSPNLIWRLALWGRLIEVVKLPSLTRAPQRR